MRFTLMIGATLVCIAPTLASADTVTATYIGNDPAAASGVTVTIGTKEYPSNYGGVFKWEGDVDYFFEKKATYNDKQFLAFCIQLNAGVKSTTFQRIDTDTDLANYVPNDSTNPSDAIGATAVDALTKLWAYEIPTIRAMTPSYNAADREEVAAMQIAIWELINDKGTFDLGTGNLTATGDIDILNRAKKLYDDSKAAYPNKPDLQLVILTDPRDDNGNGGSQDQVTAIRPVPEPTALAVWGLLCLIGLVGGRRLRRRA